MSGSFRCINYINNISLFCCGLLLLFVGVVNQAIAKNHTIDHAAPSYIPASYWETIPVAGDTVFITSGRTKALKFMDLEGEESNPIVFINKGGQVHINDKEQWGGITFHDCQHIKITGTGHGFFKYGFLLSASTCGLAFSGLSSDCEAAFVKVSDSGFAGIMAKKDYGGSPPDPAPVFQNLLIHDCFIEDVTEGMYLGETKSPGMEFRHVRVFNNIVKNTGRESLQIANMVEDVEIYNNTFLFAGNDGDTFQGNILQIGDNSVATVFNNILIGGASYGIITMGSGNNYFYNNYIASCSGVFVDNRKFTTENAPIEFSGNYFLDINNSEHEIIRNMNELNFLEVKNNFYDDKYSVIFKNYTTVNTNYEVKDNELQNLSPLKFVNPSQNDYSLKDNNPDEYKSMGAPGGPEYFKDCSDKYEIYQEQIILSADMLVDEVDGGSLNPPAYLVDEQDFTPDAGEHPISESWKPAYNMDKGPYHFYIDLGEEYSLANISLHDMNGIANLEVSVGEPGAWTRLFVESCDKYNTWKIHNINDTSRYIRFSMTESVYAAVNEILIYYFAERKAVASKNGTLWEEDMEKYLQQINAWEPEEVSIIQNPVRENLLVNIPENMADDFCIEIYDIRGVKLQEMQVGHSYSSKLSVGLSDKLVSGGMFIMRYTNNAGYSKSVKFLRSGF
ncbi:right-handed parallel beta-helix repeat-containing protein [uncultured Draconibacterium sp.]|uniref:right-handed parallel beta-helix repeat-containing protein n=1 Tax=uncultured Draconibacterium sp. TaxID=1573823 RepID=UPI0025DF39BC|nr:right-handed parallel beta-helix repeat-containing protein [uncultured Draconibacterium sp.]